MFDDIWASPFAVSLISHILADRPKFSCLVRPRKSSLWRFESCIVIIDAVLLVLVVRGRRSSFDVLSSYPFDVIDIVRLEKYYRVALFADIC